VAVLPTALRLLCSASRFFRARRIQLSAKKFEREVLKDLDTKPTHLTGRAGAPGDLKTFLD